MSEIDAVSVSHSILRAKKITRDDEKPAQNKKNKQENETESESNQHETAPKNQHNGGAHFIDEIV